MLAQRANCFDLFYELLWGEHTNDSTSSFMNRINSGKTTEENTEELYCDMECRGAIIVAKQICLLWFIDFWNVLLSNFWVIPLILKSYNLANFSPSLTIHSPRRCKTDTNLVNHRFVVSHKNMNFSQQNSATTFRASSKTTRNATQNGTKTAQTFLSHSLDGWGGRCWAVRGGRGNSSVVLSQHRGPLFNRESTSF